MESYIFNVNAVAGLFVVGREMLMGIKDEFIELFWLLLLGFMLGMILMCVRG